MSDSQSNELGFESPFSTMLKIEHFRSFHWRPSWLRCINEYLAIDNGAHVSDLLFKPNCSIARMLPGEAELVSEWTGLPGRAKSVKSFERSNGPDIALYKNYLFKLPLYRYLQFSKWNNIAISQTSWLLCQCNTLIVVYLKYRVICTIP